MKPFNSEESDNSDADLNDSLSEANEVLGDHNETLFNARVNEYREQSLNHPDSLQALLGNQNGGLFEMIHRFENCLTKAIAACDGSLHDIPEAAWMIATYNNLAKQNTGYTNAYLKREEQLRQTELGPLKRRATNDRNKFRP